MYNNSNPNLLLLGLLIFSLSSCDQDVSEEFEILSQASTPTAQKVGGYGYATYMHRPNGRWNNEMGYGLVDAYEAVKEAQNRL